VPERELAVFYKITNLGEEPAMLGEFLTASVRFINPEAYTSKVDYPENLLVNPGLSLSDNHPIQPGETKVIEVTARDRPDRLPPNRLTYDLDKSPVGILYFFTKSGELYQVEVGGFKPIWLQKK